jgi:hypothetical protein
MLRLSFAIDQDEVIRSLTVAVHGMLNEPRPSGSAYGATGHQ